MAKTAPVKKKKKKDGRHPSLDIVDSDGTQLRGKRIILCIAGSVAAYKAIELARLLMRHGCGSVTCVASKAATRLVRPAYLKWATGNDVVTDLTGDLEHIRLADYNKSDMAIVYPATANTIGKLANGIDDAPVSTVLTVALGSGIPIVVCPAMHESMQENPAVVRNMEFLRKKGVMFVGPRIAEGKARASEPEEVLERVISRLAPAGGVIPALRGKRVLLAAGPTIEYVDPVRIITNRSSGRTGVLLASELAAAGARVHMVYGLGREEPPRCAKTTRVETSAEMRKALRAKLESERFDVVIMAAAISDYAPVKKHNTKIKSSEHDTYTIRLKRVPKIMAMIKRMQPDAYLVGFKAEANVSRPALAESARNSMNTYGADMVVANDVGKKYAENPGANNVIIMTGSPSSPDVAESGWRKKEAIAKMIARAIEGAVAGGEEERRAKICTS